MTAIDDYIERAATIELLECITDLLRRGASFRGMRSEGHDGKFEYTSLVFKIPRGASRLHPERMTNEQMSEVVGYGLRPTDTSFRIIGGVRTGVWDRDEHGWRREAVTIGRSAAEAKNLDHFMRHGPGLSYGYQAFVIARWPSTGEILLGGLGGMGVGQMWMTENADHKRYPGYDEAEVLA